MVVLRQTVNLFRKVNIVGSTPTPSTKYREWRNKATASDLKSEDRNDRVGSTPTSRTNTVLINSMLHKDRFDL